MTSECDAVSGSCKPPPTHGIGKKPVLHAVDRQFAAPVHEIAPRVIELAQARHHCHDRADIDTAGRSETAADTQRATHRYRVHQVHAEVHAVLELVDAHVEGEDAFDVFVVRYAGLDDVATDLAQDANALPGATVDRPLDRRHEQRLGQQK